MDQIIYRFLKARAETDKGANTLSALMEHGRDVDAVILDMDKLESNEQILDFSSMAYYLMEIENTLVLVYPTEEREKFFKIQDSLRFGDSIAYNGFTYAELDAVKDYLDAADIDYKINTATGARMGVLVSKTDADIMKQAVQALTGEVSTEVGERYLNVKNQCWALAVSQVSQAMDSELAFIGSDGGSNGILIGPESALVMTSKSVREISRQADDFQKQVIHAVMEDLNGKENPVKAFFNQDAQQMAYGMTRYEPKALTPKEALNLTGFQTMPDLDTLAQFMEQDLPEEQKKAAYALLRMDLCRMMKMQDEVKLSPSEKKEYKALHEHMTRQFASQFERQKIQEDREDKGR